MSTRVKLHGGIIHTQTTHFSSEWEMVYIATPYPQSHVILCCAAELETAMRDIFHISPEAECRVLHRYMTHTYELLSNKQQILQDAGLYNGQVMYAPMT